MPKAPGTQRLNRLMEQLDQLCNVFAGDRGDLDVSSLRSKLEAETSRRHMLSSEVVELLGQLDDQKSDEGTITAGAAQRRLSTQSDDAFEVSRFSLGLHGALLSKASEVDRATANGLDTSDVSAQPGSLGSSSLDLEQFSSSLRAVQEALHELQKRIGPIDVGEELRGLRSRLCNLETDTVDSLRSLQERIDTEKSASDGVLLSVQGLQEQLALHAMRTERTLHQANEAILRESSLRETDFRILDERFEDIDAKSSDLEEAARLQLASVDDLRQSLDALREYSGLGEMSHPERNEIESIMEEMTCAGEAEKMGQLSRSFESPGAPPSFRTASNRNSLRRGSGGSRPDQGRNHSSPTSLDASGTTASATARNDGAHEFTVSRFASAPSRQLRTSSPGAQLSQQHTPRARGSVSPGPVGQMVPAGTPQSPTASFVVPFSGSISTPATATSGFRQLGGKGLDIWTTAHSATGSLSFVPLAGSGGSESTPVPHSTSTVSSFVGCSSTPLGEQRSSSTVPVAPQTPTYCQSTYTDTSRTPRCPSSPPRSTQRSLPTSPGAGSGNTRVGGAPPGTANSWVNPASPDSRSAGRSLRRGRGGLGRGAWSPRATVPMPASAWRGRMPPEASAGI